MKKRIISSIICALVLLTMTIVANASWTNSATAYYRSGYTYPPDTKVPYATKMTSSLGNQILSYNKSSWTAPKIGIADDKKAAMTVLSTTRNSSTEALWMTSMARPGNQYSVVIYGSTIQVGTDTMTVRFNLDAPDAPPVA